MTDSPKAQHPNRQNFEGVLTRLGIPSDKAPFGAVDLHGHYHKLIIPTEVARAALDSLRGMPVGFNDCWGVHNFQQRCGVIEEGEIRGDELWVRGYIFARDFPTVVRMLRGGKLGMSCELGETDIENFNSAIWTVKETIFCGAAVLFASLAAWTTTRVSIAASGAGSEGPDDEHRTLLMPSNVAIKSFKDGPR